MHFRRGGAPRGKQFPFRFALEKFGLRRQAVALHIGLFQDLADALERHRQRLEIFRLANRAQRRQPLFGIQQVVGPGAKNRADFIVAVASAFAEDVARTVQNEVEDLRFLLRRYALLGRQGMEGFRRRADRRRQRYRQLLVQNNLHYAESCAAQCIGVARAGGHEPHREAADDRIQLVGHGHRAADQIARDGIVQPHGTVVIVDGVGDVIGFTLRPCIESADDAL